jgi:lipoprotein-releasing system permease protein
MNGYEPFIALRHLKNQSRSFLSTITIIAIVGVFIGVMALTAVMSVTGGFQKAFQDRVLGINSHILVVKYGIHFKNYRSIQTDLEKIDGVKGTSPFILHEMIADHEGQSKGVLVKGLDPETLKDISKLPQYLEDESDLDAIKYERFPEDGDKQTPGILVGKQLAEKLNIDKGDELRVTSPLQNLDAAEWSSKDHKPATRLFDVEGVFQSGFYEYDSRLVIADYRALQEYFEEGDTVTGVDMRLHDVSAVKEVAERVEKQLADGPFNVMTWRELNKNLFKSLRLQRTVLAVLFCFIVLVASFNVICTLLMIVLDKKKQIAILKAMGATRFDIAKIFIWEGVIIGAIGTVLGLIGGLVATLIVKNVHFGLDPSIYRIDHLPVDIRPLEFAGVGIVSMLICFLATLGPAIWASSFNPVEGIRYE